MIKSELVQRIAEHNPHLYQRDVENIVNAILDEIVAALARGDRVELRGFGAFSVKHRPARAGRNARTAEPRQSRGRHLEGPLSRRPKPFGRFHAMRRLIWIKTSNRHAKVPVGCDPYT